MKVLEKISDFFGKYMAIIVLVVAALALFAPGTCLWKARSGITVNCARQPMIISLGRENTSLKSSSFKVRPIPNITIIKR